MTALRFVEMPTRRVEGNKPVVPTTGLSEKECAFQHMGNKCSRADRLHFLIGFLVRFQGFCELFGVAGAGA